MGKKVGSVGYWLSLFYCLLVGNGAWAEGVKSKGLPESCTVVVSSGAIADFRQSYMYRADTAVFSPGDGEKLPGLEPQLIANGIDAILIKSPTPEDIAALRGRPGYHFGPLVTTWHQPARTYEEYIDSRDDLLPAEKSRKKSAFRTKFRKLGAEISLQRLPLTVENWKLFYEKLYKPFVVGKEFGIDIAGENLPGLPGLKPELFTLVVLTDTTTGEPVGGCLIERFPTESIVKMRAAAFNKNDKYRNMYLSFHTYNQTVQIAKEEGFQTLSYGSDPNYWGSDMVPPFLMSFKAGLGYEPQYWNVGPFGTTRILKILNIEKIGNPFYLTFEFTGATAESPVRLVQVGEMPEAVRSNFSFPMVPELLAGTP